MNAKENFTGEDFRHAIFGAADDIAFITTDISGPQARIIDFSPGAEHIFGYERDEIVGEKFSRLYKEKDFNSKFFTQVDPKKPGVTREVSFVRKSGKEFPAIFTRYAIHDTQDNLVATLGVAVDISQKKRVEKALKFSNSELRQLFNIAVDGMRVIDKEFNILRISDTFLKLAKVGKEEAMQKKCYEVLGGELCNTSACPLQLILNGEKNIEYEVQKERIDGSKIACLLTAIPFKGLEGEVIGIVEHFKDISVREEFYEALKKSEAKYSTVVENSLTGIYIEVNEVVEFANARFAEIFGCTSDELAGMETQNLVHPDYLALLEDVRRELLNGDRTSAEIEVKCLTLNNQTIWAKVRDTLIEFEGRTAILGNLVDITERKKMEEALKESEKTLKILSSHLFTAQEDERKRLAIELHDGIGQTLSAIKFCAETCLKQSENGIADGGRGSLDKVINLTQHAIEEARQISMDLRPSTLDDLGILATIKWFCREFQSIYSSILIEQHITISEEEVTESIKTVIFRVIQEALSNVAKHSRASHIRLALLRSENHIDLVIEDNGVGFDQSESQASRSLIKGFGLAGMRERVEFSGGVFIVMSMKGAGTFLRAKWPVQKLTSAR